MPIPPNRREQKFADFLRDNCPVAPSPKANLDRQLMQKLDRVPREKMRLQLNYRWGIYSVLAAGCLFTTANLGYKNPLAVEVIELENFLVNSWNETLKPDSLAILDEPELDWLLPRTLQNSQTQPISVSTR